MFVCLCICFDSMYVWLNFISTYPYTVICIRWNKVIAWLIYQWLMASIRIIFMSGRNKPNIPWMVTFKLNGHVRVTPQATHIHITQDIANNDRKPSSWRFPEQAETHPVVCCYTMSRADAVYFINFPRLLSWSIVHCSSRQPWPIQHVSKCMFRSTVVSWSPYQVDGWPAIKCWHLSQSIRAEWYHCVWLGLPAFRWLNEYCAGTCCLLWSLGVWEIVGSHLSRDIGKSFSSCQETGKVFSSEVALYSKFVFGQSNKPVIPPWALLRRLRVGSPRGEV